MSDKSNNAPETAMVKLRVAIRKPNETEIFASTVSVKMTNHQSLVAKYMSNKFRRDIAIGGIQLISNVGGCESAPEAVWDNNGEIIGYSGDLTPFNPICMQLVPIEVAVGALVEGRGISDLVIATTGSDGEDELVAASIVLADLGLL